MAVMMEMRVAQRQTQTISPRLQHAVRLLQMSSLEFAAMVQEQLGRNPFLEGEDDGDARAAGDDEVGHGIAAAEPDTPIDERALWHGEAGHGLRRAAENETAAMEWMAEPRSLAAHLREQINVMQLPERDRLLATVIVESLDPDGYLRSSLEELAGLAQLAPSAEPVEMQIALRRVQALDPPGVGARSVAECLMLQLPGIECPDLRALAGTVVGAHLRRLAAHDVNGLAQALGVPPARAEAVCQRLRRLDPRPGWRFESAQPDYVLPDVLARRTRGAWQVALNPAVVPRVRFNQVYAELFQRHRAHGDGELAAHLQEARWTVRNVEQRFSTILDVADAIVRRQRHFLEFGAMAMRPLALREIAQEVGVHESTVSRVTHNKYIATPSGVYELKYFFSRPLVSRNGSECSGTAIRGLIQDMIGAESREAPLSDAEVARQLSRQGLTVARRTVTKYRQMLRIAAVERRRVHA